MRHLRPYITMMSSLASKARVTSLLLVDLMLESPRTPQTLPITQEPGPALELTLRLAEAAFRFKRDFTVGPGTVPPMKARRTISTPPLTSLTATTPRIPQRFGHKSMNPP